MSLLGLFAKVGQGLAEGVALHQMEKEARKPSRRRKRAQAQEGCSPCAAGAYIADLQQQIKSWRSGGLGGG